MRKKWLKGVAVISSIFLTSAIIIGVYTKEKQGMQPDHDVLVVAHRAGAAYAPENTISALEQAIIQGAEIAEIDIRQLPDGTLVVLHDNNFLRTTGVNLKVWEADYQACRKLDAGYYFQGNYTGERVPTLDEMLEFAKGRIRLMLDIKTCGYEENLEFELVQTLFHHDMEWQCIVGSKDLGVLERVKELAPMVETVYIARSLKESDYELVYVDSYSVKLSNMNEAMVERVHARDKLIYGWTANSRSHMKTIISYGADGIVTDDVPLALKVTSGSINFPQ